MGIILTVPCAEIASGSRVEGRGWRMCQMVDFGGGDIEPRADDFQVLITIFHTE